jgi:hypothetical protein
MAYTLRRHTGFTGLGEAPVIGRKDNAGCILFIVQLHLRVAFEQMSFFPWFLLLDSFCLL